MAELTTQELLTELHHQGNKIALSMGENWRIANPEFMDALEAAGTRLREYRVFLHEFHRIANADAGGA